MPVCSYAHMPICPYAHIKSNGAGILSIEKKTRDTYHTYHMEIRCPLPICPMPICPMLHTTYLLIQRFLNYLWDYAHAHIHTTHLLTHLLIYLLTTHSLMGLCPYQYYILTYSLTYLLTHLLITYLLTYLLTH